MSVTEEPVDFAECGREPVQFPGAVQSYGVLIAARPPGPGISHVSENCDRLLGCYPEELLGQPVRRVLGSAADPVVAELAALAAGARYRRRIALTVRGEVRRFDLLGHRVDDRLIIELEPAPPAETDADLALSAAFLSAVAAGGNLSQLARATAVEVRRLCGYARVVVYRLAEDGSGEVVAEERLPALTPLIGLRFPPHDFPPQAQRLQAAVGVRVIPDMNGVPAPLHAVAADAAVPLDLGLSQLRAVSRFCVQYHRNIGVAATMTASIMVDRRMWGFVSCRHDVATTPSWRLRDAVLACATRLGAAIARLETEATVRARARAVRCHRLLLEAMAGDDPLGRLILGHPRLTSLIGASGAALVAGTEVFRRGATPPAAEIAALARWLVGRMAAGPDGAGAPPVVSLDALSTAYPLGEAWQDVASGVLAAVLDAEPPVCLLCFRPEVRHEVFWAGDPDHPVTRDDADKLTPRGSFERWRQQVSGHARPWTEDDRRLVGEFARRVPSASERLALVRRVVADCDGWFRRDDVVREEMLAAMSDYMVITVRLPAGAAAIVVSVNARLCDAFSLDETELVGCPAGDAVERIGLPSGCADPDRPVPPECEVWSDLMGLRTVRIWRETIAESAGAGGSAQLLLLRLQDVTEFRRSNDALRAARAEADAAEQAKAQFLASMSHELRTPLNAIIGFAEAIKAEILGPIGIAAYRGYAHDISQSGQHLLTVITDMLEMSKLTAGRRPLDEAVFPLDEMVAEALRWVEQQFADKGLTWQLSMPDHPVVIKADGSAIRQIVINLLTNAGKYTPGGGSVTVRVIAPDLGDIVLSVEDTGIGIPASEIGGLLKPFVRARDPRIAGIGGSGLGLSISKVLVDLHGGRIDLISDGQSGTTARVLLPSWRRVAWTEG